MKTYYATDAFDKNVADYEAWYEAYPEVYTSELSAIRTHFERLPENIRGIEVGLGTGRFSVPLGIREGIEPSAPMAAWMPGQNSCPMGICSLILCSL